MKRVLSIALIAVSVTAMAQMPRVSGDVNGDGYVTAADVTALYDFLLNNDGSNIINGDQNGDSVITASDITSVYDIMLIVTYGHKYVDLGLPSGTLWATMNIGASRPEDYGDYFAWGETTPKDVYSYSTYQWCNGSFKTLTKYCLSINNGIVDNKTELDPEDDAATANWGSEWRMPSFEQIQELMNNCTWQWTTQSSVNGLLLTSNINGASLFLPAAGHRYDSVLSRDGSFGYYWSRMLAAPNSVPYELLFIQESAYWGDNWYGGRADGQSVRAVRVSQN